MFVADAYAVLDLFVRGFAPEKLRRLCARRLARYEMRDVVDATPPRDAIGIPVMSGAFVLARRQAIDRTGGFDPRFFLYFEDFDWSVRLAAVAPNAFVPSVNVAHHGGGAARKGFRHVAYFVRGGARFYANFDCVVLDCARVDIGDGVFLGPAVQIYAATHPLDPVERISGLELARPVRIGSRVWIGGGAIVLPGVTIGDGTTIGAGSVVARDIPAGVLAVGNPCRVVRAL